MNKILTFELKKIALLDNVYFNYETKETFHQKVYLNSEYILAKTKNSGLALNLINSSGINREIDCISQIFVPIEEIENIMSNSEYNDMLIDMLFETDSYDQVNFVFQLLYETKELSREQLKIICDYFLKNIHAKRSFTAQRLMRAFMNNNKAKITNEKCSLVLENFPMIDESEKLITGRLI